MSTAINIQPEASCKPPGASEVLHSMPDFSPEMKVLLCCGGPLIHARNDDRLARLIHSDLDWDFIPRLASYHGMLPLLYWNLLEREGYLHRGRVPAAVMEVLKTAYLRNVGKSLEMTANLLEIVEKFNGLGIIVVPYKGPILSTRLYGNLGLRQSVDLDILVKKQDLEQARQALVDLKYSPAVMLYGPTHEFQVESRYSDRFERPGSVVELHWAFTNKDVAFPMALDDLVPRLTTQLVSGRSIPVFSYEDTLLILCIHGAKHGWARLEWICGVAEALCYGDKIAWPELLSRATATRSLQRLLLGLCLAHDLFLAPLPDLVKAKIREGKKTTALAVAVSSSLFDKGRKVNGIQTFGSIDHDLFHFRLSDRISDRLNYLAYRLTTPSRSEQWSIISVVGRPIRLHSFTRPIGIVIKLIPAVWRRLYSGLGGRE